jgi:hypothetical protein
MRVPGSSSFAAALGAALLFACGSDDAARQADPADRDEPVAAAPDEPPQKRAPREYPFDTSPDDRASIDAHGFAGTRRAPEGSGYELGLRVVGILPYGCLKEAGLEEGDLIVELGGVTFPADHDDPIGLLRERLEQLEPEEVTTLTYVRKDTPPTRVEIVLGRRPPRFNGLDTDPSWFSAPVTDPFVEDLIRRALALDGGELRYADTLKRNRERMARTDAFRLRETVQVHMNLAANEPLARSITDGVAGDPLRALWLVAGEARVEPSGELEWEVEPEKASLEQLVNMLQRVLEGAAREVRAVAADLSDEERAFFLGNLEQLTSSLSDGPYLHYDEDVGRERTNRRLVKLLGRIDRGRLESAASALLRDVRVLIVPLQRAAQDEAERQKDAEGKGLGLLLGRDTGAGRIEIWGPGDQRHTKRCAFRMDVGGDDDYLDVAGRADFEHPVSLSFDLWGDDLYGATSPGCQGAGIGGVGVLVDVEGDDQYVARHWSQGCGLAGFGLLQDLDGDDVYRSIDLCQGVGLVGAGVLMDHDGSDRYAAQLYAQGVGRAAGVGALVDHAGNDRYACTGRNQSGYGEPGLFEGWGQGCGFGFRHVTSGGIAMLVDRDGDDVYEAGNFSQGGGYHYAWGILRDDAGNDRYIGSRYAQGFAAHQAQATFLEGGGDDVYQSHSSVAQGLSWDETSVFFRDRGGADRYGTRGFSLAAAAHNGMVVFIDDAGRDRYRAPPGRANSNDYHGGWSFSLFVDAGADDDAYGTTPVERWNDRVSWKHEGAYHLDCSDPAKPLHHLVRQTKETDE